MSDDTGQKVDILSDQLQEDCAVLQKRKSRDDDESGDDTDDNEDITGSDSDSDASDDTEELEELQRLMKDIQEAKQTNKELKEKLMAHAAKRSRTEDHSELGFVSKLFRERAEDQKPRAVSNPEKSMP